MRMLFCLFADSIGLLPKHLFRSLLQSEDRFYPKRFLRKLTALFEAMSAPDGIFGEHTIKYFNGGLFDSSSIIELDKTDLGILYEVSKNYNWAHVAPEIFGTLFERSLNKERRSLIGAHYTSAEDILLLIEPVLMRPLEQRWSEVRASILVELEAERRAEETATARQSRLRTHTPRSEELLGNWLNELTRIKVLDPACGSGNFLYLALRRMLDLWLETSRFAHEHNISLVLPTMVSPRQLYGIETEFYAHELASIVVWIGYLQWKHEHGIAEDREPILQKLDNIQHADAILRYDEQDNPYEPEWPQADFIIGNPPFLGGKLLRRELGDQYVDDLFDLYRGRVKAESDLVVYWFEKARAQIEVEEITRVNSLRVGLLATQGIRGGANRNVLERILRTGNIFWAISDRNWLLDGANVHVSMIAFERGRIAGIKHPLLRDHEEEKLRRRVQQENDPPVPGMLRHAEKIEAIQRLDIRRRQPGVLDQLHAEAGTTAPTAHPIPAQGNALGKEIHEQRGLKAWPIPPLPIHDLTEPCILDGEPVPFINPDLTTGSNTASAHRIKENQGICFMGTTKVGAFDIDTETARKMLAAPTNPNGRPNSDVVRPWVNATDITRGSRGMFIIDFGVDMKEEAAALYEQPFEYVKHYVKPVRSTNKRENYATNWWIHGEARSELRKAVQPITRYIATPRHSRHRVFVWLPKATIPDSANFAFAREDDYFIGVLHSTAHEMWARAQGTQVREVESGFRYTPDSTFDTFPFPWPPGKEPSEDSDPHVKAIADAARELVRLRDAWLNPPGASEDDLKDRTLTKLYNQHPEWPANAHRTLDEAVFAAYGWPPNLSRDEILSRLLALNHERAAASQVKSGK
jgi:type II restriction/modification system DNA methylase subunit YeeA